MMFNDMVFIRILNESSFQKLYEKDPRTDAFFLSSSPLPPILIVALYLYLVFSLLPRYMQNRPAYKLDGFVIYYNILQILLNLYLVYLSFIRWQTLNWFCSPVDYSDTPEGWLDLRNTHLFLVVKIFDLIDTIIFVLRKKNNQVTVLHVFHHVMMVGTCWFGLAFWGGGHVVYIGLVNSLVHSVMYFYYLLTIWKPEQKKNLWWKKHLTQLQLGQFGFFLATFGQLLFRSSCNFSKIASTVAFTGSAIMVVMFGNFYYKAYVQHKKKFS